VHVVGYDEDKKALLKRLARVEGQVRGVARMVEEDRYCIDVLDQVSAITSAMQKVAMSLVREHMDHCVAEAVRSDDDGGRAKLDEAAQAIERLVRS
jgi:CsoR family transcriptional regulator, copper-sensing transcriptional repressor